MDAGTASAIVRSGLRRVALVGLKDNQGVLAKAQCIEFVQDTSDLLIQGRDQGRVGPPGLRQRFVVPAILVVRLHGIVRRAEGGVQEERVVPVRFDETHGLADDKVP